MNLQNKCKYLLITSNNLKNNNEISLKEYNLLKELIFSFNSSLYSYNNINDIKLYLNNYIHQLYNALYENLTLERAHILATTYVDEINDTDTRALVYGEVDFESFAEVLKVATDNLKNYNKFIDLGHGIGRAVIVAAFLTNFKEYHGIEIIRSLHETSLGVVKKFIRRINPLLSHPPLIHLTHGSFLTEPLASSWTDADLVFANSTCFPDELIADIAERCISLPVGSRVITFTTSLRSEYFKILYKKRLFMSWGPATVFIHERMPDSEVLPGVVDRYSTSFRPTLSLPIPLPSLNISLSEIDNIDEDYDSLNPLPPTRTDNSSSLATTPSGTLNWDPDTPTLKAWAKRELALSRNQLEGLSGGESSEEDNVDTVGGRVSKSNCTTSLSTKEDEITINSDEDEDDNNDDNNNNKYNNEVDAEDDDSEGEYRLHINRLAYNTGRDGRIHPDYDMSDSTDDNYNDNDNDNYDDSININYYNNYYNGNRNNYNSNHSNDNDDDDDDDEDNESDLDDNQEEVDDLVERYYHVDDDDDDDIEREGDSDEEIDEIYDDTS